MKIGVDDNRIGIAPYIQERSFDRFFTTEGLGVFTGHGSATMLPIGKSREGLGVCTVRPKKIQALATAARR